EYVLPTTARHVVGVSGQGIFARGVEPNLCTVVAVFPGGGRAGGKLNPSFRQHTLSIENAVVKVQHAEPGPVAGCAIVKPANNEMSQAVGFQRLPADANAVEQLGLMPRKRVCT